MRRDRAERKDDQGPRAARRRGHPVPDDAGVPRRARREPAGRHGRVLTADSWRAKEKQRRSRQMARTGKVTVVGAGFYGSTTAQRLAEYDIFDEVVLTDNVEGETEGLALDMSQSRPIEGFETTITGQTTGQSGEGYEAIAGSRIVVVTAGLPRKPGMSRMDLIEVNAKIVRTV